MNRYQDSQESDDPAANSQDLFGHDQDDRQHDNNYEDRQHNHEARGFCCQGCRENNVLLKDILKELQNLQEGQRGNPVVIEKSALELPLQDYLRARFPKSLFLNDPDVELKSKLVTLGRKFMPQAEVNTLSRVGVRYATRKMTDYRSQIKMKLLSKKLDKPDLGRKNIEDLSKDLFGKFLVSDRRQTENMAAALRSFCHEKSLLRNQAQPQEDIDFWGCFKKYLQDIYDDPAEDKWENIQEREARRIERYNRN